MTSEEYYQLHEKARRQYLSETQPFVEILTRCEFLATGFKVAMPSGKVFERVYPEGVEETRSRAQDSINQIKERIFSDVNRSFPMAGGQARSPR